MEVHPAEYANLPLHVDIEHGKAEDQHADDDTQPRPSEWSVNRALDWCKQHYGYFKTSAFGILIIQRWLPIQDYGSDSLVTFCPDAPGSVLSLLCSDTGLWWTDDWWWGHLSASFIILPYVPLWMSIAPILMNLAASSDYRDWLSAVVSLTWTYWCVSAASIVLRFDWSTLACKLGLLMTWASALLFGLTATRLIGPSCRQHLQAWSLALVMPAWVAYFLGMLAGLYVVPQCVLFSSFLLDCIPWLHMRTSTLITWVCFGLPVVFLLDFIMILAFPFKDPTYSWMRNIGRLRCVSESLIESPTQCPLQVRIAIYRFLHRGARFPWTILFSIGTSVLSITLTWMDLRADAKALNISTIEVVWDLLLVGLQRHAPLLHLLHVSESVDYAPEGRLRSNHLTEIFSVCRVCGGLRELHFGKDSGLGIEHIKDILPLTTQLSIVDAPGFLSFSPGTLTIEAPLSAEDLELLLPYRHNFDVIDVKDLTIPANHGFGPEVCAKLKPLQLSKLVIDADNSIGRDGCEHLGTFVDLSSLVIGSKNQVGHEGCTKLMRLERLISLQIDGDNGIGFAGRRGIGEDWNLTLEKCKEILSLAMKIGFVEIGGALRCTQGEMTIMAAVFEEHLELLLPLTEQLAVVVVEEEDLTIPANHGFRPGGCAKLKPLKLRKLVIGDDNSIGLDGCDHLSALADLNTLQIGSDNDVGHQGCAKLMRLKKLVSLQIGDGNRIGQKGCDHLSHLINLETLQIGSDNGIGHQGCAKLVRLNKLVSLQIGDGNRIGHEGCHRLSNLFDLSTLQIGNDNDIGHQGCAKLMRLKELVSLQIGDRNQIGHKGCDHLSNLIYLETLQIGSRNEIGHEGCTKLMKLRNMERLKIGPANDITQKDEEDWRSNKSQVLVVLDISVD